MSHTGAWVKHYFLNESQCLLISNNSQIIDQRMAMTMYALRSQWTSDSIDLFHNSD